MEANNIVNVYKDYSNNYYLKFNITNKRTINSILTYFVENGERIEEANKLTDSFNYYLISKHTTRNSRFSINKFLLSNEPSKITASMIKQTVKHYDCIFAQSFSENNNTSIFLKLGKRSSAFFTTHRFVIYHIIPDRKEWLPIMCFQKFKVIASISEYLSLVYYSNSVRYKDILKKTANKIDKLISNKKKGKELNASTEENLERFKAEYDKLDKHFKSFAKDKNNIHYSECVDFNNQCLSLQNLGRRLAFELSYDLEEDIGDDDNYAIQVSRNDCVFYRGLTNASFNCWPKVYRDSTFLNLEDTTYREYRMKFPDRFEGKTAIESITLMQHFGCPTRLLDITTNPLVALFMACYDGFSPSDESSSFGEIITFFPRFINEDNEIKYYDSVRIALISCLSKLDINEKNVLRKISYRSPYAKLSIKEFFDVKSSGEVTAKAPSNGISRYSDMMMKGQTALKHLISIAQREQNISFDNIRISDLLKSYYVKTPFNNDRIRAQSGCFILCGLDPNYIDVNFSTSRNHQEFYRIIIKDKQNLLSELQQLNIHQASMMPDMQNVADYLTKHKY